MPAQFEELDYAKTSLGDLTLWRRQVLSLRGQIVYEIRLDGEFLMSSLVNASEIALATGTLAKASSDAPLDVLVGGLGLGYTAQAALAHPAVRTVEVVEQLAEIIGWHERGLVPLGEELTGDPRCRFVRDDFYTFITREDCRYHAILLDIDHSPEYLLRPEHASFYTSEGLRGVRARLHAGGVFAFWSADPIGGNLAAVLGAVFSAVETEEISFLNPLTGERDVNYLCRAQA